jgi:hypothetical protein
MSGRSGVRFSVGARDFLFSRNLLTGARVHTAPCSMGIGASSLGVDWPDRDVKHTSPSNVHVKMEGYVPPPPIYRNGVNRENFTLTFMVVYAVG